MTVFEWIGIIALATVVAWVLVECCRRYALATNWMDCPNERSFHDKPTPRIGGIALLFMSGAGLLLFSPSGAISLIWILALLMGLVTLFDDRFELPRLLRFGIQTIVALIAVVAYSGIFISGGFPLLGNALPSWALVVMVLIWIVGLTNAYNFMDGIDGIAAIQGIVVVLGWSSISVATSGSEASDWILMTLLLGALLGFLAHNWSPARIFMGDGGSTFLGFLFALFPVAFAAAGRMELERALEAGFLFLWPFIFDTSTAFVRRVWKREPVFTAHRSHLYQVLAATYATRSGGHRITAAIYGGLSLIGIGLYWTPGPLWAKIGVCAWLWLALAAWTYGIRAEKIKVTTIDKKGKNKAPLGGQQPMNFKIFLSPPEISGAEQKWVAKAFASGFIAPVGPQLNTFEEQLAEWLEVPEIAAVSSGTAANHLGLRALGVGPGDCVLCPDLTFIATVNPVRYLGAEPVLVDVDKATFSMDVQRAEEAIEALKREGRTIRAMVVVHAFGIPANLDPLLELAEAHGIAVLEDCAGAFGTTLGGRYAGTLAHAASFSFNGNKVLTTSGGGALRVRDPELMTAVRSWTNQGKAAGQVGYVHESLGYNYKLSNISAAIGLGQLETVRERLDRKRSIYNSYKTLFADDDRIHLMPEPPHGTNNYWLTVLGVDSRADAQVIVNSLRHAGIEAAPMWKPMHEQSINQDLRVFGGEISKWISRHYICLPSGTHLKQADIQQIHELVMGAMELPESKVGA